MVTAQLFIEALESPSEPLRKVLNDPHPACRFEDGSPRIRRLTDFFEADVVCRGTLFRVAAPIRREISRETVRNAGRLNDIGSPRISGFRLAEEAMAWLDERGELRTEHLFVEQVPEGRPLDEALDRGYSAAALHRELTALQQEFARIGFSHGNLKPENLLLTPNDRLIVTRCYRARFDGPSPEDERSFAALHRLADQKGDPQHRIPETNSEETVDYPGEWAGPCSEGMRPILTKGVYRFVDVRRKKLIKRSFQAVESFYEGRAVVRTREKFGVIDKTGEFVIAPFYDEIIYNRNKSLFYGRLQDQWCTLSYTGKPLTAFVKSQFTAVPEEA